MANRRKFLLAGLGAASLWALARSIFVRKPASGKARFLTHDGRLVEVDIEKLPLTGRVAAKTEIQKWVQRKKS